jgi:hypothetical protein
MLINLLGEETIVWTVPVPRRARDLVTEYEVIGLQEEPDKDRQKEILKDLPDTVQLRMTLSSVTVVESTRRDELLFKVSQEFEKLYEVDPATYSRWFQEKWLRKRETSIVFPGSEDFDERKAITVYNHLQELINWSSVMACLRKVEMRSRPLIVNGAGPPPWEEVEIPMEWLECGTFARVVPTALFQKMVDVMESLNPNLWGASQDEDSKNFGGIN